LRWENEGRDWPNREASRFVRAAGLTWHVQAMGQGPSLLLVHGTGAATHSWRDLAPLLAERFAVVAPDLPGHGFTEKPPLRGLGLPAMAAALGALLAELAVQPRVVVGHSAGAAILVRMALDGQLDPDLCISLNGALLPFRGLPGKLFGPAARLLALNPLVPRLFARRAREPAVLGRLVDNTGSTLDRRGIELYGRLAADHRHVGGALGMMAAWDLEPLVRDLPGLACPLVLVVGSHDRTVSPSNAARVQALLPSSRIVRLDRLGHLMHEEAPATVARLIEAEARRFEVLQD